MKIRKGDEVCVIAGKNKGRRGIVSKVLRDEGKVLIEGVNFCKHFVRPNPDKGIRGGIETKEAPLPISNVMLFDKEAGKGTRVGYRFSEDGSKLRFYKASKRMVSYD